MKFVLLPILFFVVQPCFSQKANSDWKVLQGLKGTWMSSIDEQYREHPMIKKFNPEMKPQLMVFEPNRTGEMMTLSIYNLDKPSVRDTTLFVYGTIIPSESGKIKMVEFNVSTSTVFLGNYYVTDEGDIVREFEDVTAETTRKLKEVWRTVGKDQNTFDWHTYTFVEGKYVEGDIVVRLTKLNRPKP